MTFAFCHSRPCCKDRHGNVGKPQQKLVPRGTLFCMDCKNVLVWKKKNQNLIRATQRSKIVQDVLDWKYSS